MEFMDYAREWTVKNVPALEGCRDDILDVCKFLSKDDYALYQLFVVEGYLHRLIRDFERNPSFYEPLNPPSGGSNVRKPYR